MTAGEAALDALRVLARPPGWLLAATDGDVVGDALRRQVPEMRAGDLHLVTCALQDLRAKGNRWPVRYLVTVDGPAGGTRSLTLAGTLRPPVTADADGWAGAPAAFGTPGWAATLPGLGLALETDTGDTGLPALRRLTDPAAAAALLEDGLAQAYPGIRVAGCEPRVARYRPGNRCTVVYALRYGPDADPRWPSAVVAKTSRGDEGATTDAALRALRAAGLGSTGTPAVAEPLAYLPDAKVLLTGAVEGEHTVADLVASGVGGGRALDELRRALRSTADGLVALHGCELRYGEQRTPGIEAARLRKAAARLDAACPAAAEAVDAVSALLEQRAGEVAPQPTRLAHGAFRPAQVLVHRDAVGFLDFDGLGMSEPAQDLGRFCGKLRAIGLSAGGADATSRPGVVDELAAHFLDRYAEQAPVSGARVAVWEALDLLKGLLQAWTRGRPDRAAPVSALLEARLREMA